MKPKWKFVSFINFSNERLTSFRVFFFHKPPSKFLQNRQITTEVKVFLVSSKKKEKKKRKKKDDTFFILIDSAGESWRGIPREYRISDQEADSDSRRTETRGGPRVYNTVTSMATIATGTSPSRASNSYWPTFNGVHADRKVIEVGIANLNSIGTGGEWLLLFHLLSLFLLFFRSSFCKSVLSLTRSISSDF